MGDSSCMENKDDYKLNEKKERKKDEDYEMSAFNGLWQNS